MKIVMTGRQMSVRESLKQLTEQKLAKFDKFFGEDTEARVAFNCKHDRQNVEITISYGGTLFRSEESADTFQSAIDEAVESLDRQIRKNKTRLERRFRSGGISFADPSWETAEEDEEFRIRVKEFEFNPMSVEEAIMQMNLLEHQFYVFNDAETGSTCVVYKRKDGDYGLIAPAKGRRGA